MPSDKSKQRFLHKLEKLGGRAANKRLREALGWQEPTYDNVRGELVEEGRIIKGRGQGGSIRLADVEGAGRDNKGVLEHLKAEKLKIDRFSEKQSTRDAIHVEIRDFLWSDKIGLPDPQYSEEEVEGRAEAVFMHVLRRYGGSSGRRLHA